MITRRTAIAAAAGLAAGPASAQPQAASQPAARNAYAFAFEGIDGREIALRQFAGRPFMVVNTASRCGFTGQYEGLQQIWSRYRQRGFTVVGVPSNDFAGQEPGSNDEILGFCSQTYGVTFPLAAKGRVIGDGAHPFYRWAATERPADRPRWNFHKYLLGRDGRIAAVFATSTKPTDPQVIAGIERTLSGPSPAS
jgi:glutathione peroxidase